MSEREDEAKKALTEAGGEAGADAVDYAVGGLAGAAAAPLLGPGAAAVGAGTVALIKTVRSLLRSHHESRRRERVEAFENALVGAVIATGGIPEELAVDELFAEAVFQGYRRTMDAVDPATVAPIARLVALFGQQGPAPFFRRCGRFLQDSGATELDALRAVLLRSLEQVPNAPDETMIGIGWSDAQPSETLAEAGSSSTHTPHPEDDVENLLEAYRSLDVHGLGRCRERMAVLPTCDVLAGNIRRLVMVLTDARGE